MEVKTILSLLGLEYTNLEVDNTILEDENAYIIYAKLKLPSKRECPHCHSNNVVVDDKKIVTIKFSVVFHSNKPIYLRLTKTRFKCKNCNKKFVQTIDNLIRRNHQISNDLCWKISYLSKQIVTFKFIAESLNLSVPTVITIFDEITKVKRKPLTKVLCIDEKRFNTYNSKFICILSNGLTGGILDILPSRRKEYLFDYFASFSELELNRVKFFCSDMFEGYKTIKKNFFKNAIHIIDHFHIKKLFIETIQTIRKREMKKYEKTSLIYRTLKSKRKIFLIDITKNKYRNSYFDYNGELIDSIEEARRIIVKCDEFYEIYMLYLDFCSCIGFERSKNELEVNLNFIIDKCLSSTSKEIIKIGSTLFDFFDEIINTFSYVNEYHISNSVAEGNNNYISTLLKISYGIKDFNRLRKRLLIAKKSEG